MKRNIAIAVALIVVLGIFLMSSSSSTQSTSGERSSLFSGLSLPFLNQVPNLNDSFNTTAAWGVFQDYLKFAQARNLEGVKSLSYQVSEVCADPERAEECNVLMNSVYIIAKDFRLEDFKNVSYDDQQIIMSTDYMDLYEGADQTKVVLYFVKSESGEPKVLGIRFCYGKDSGGFQCVKTNPEDRDTDQDGWWDDVEALFK